MTTNNSRARVAVAALVASLLLGPTLARAQAPMPDQPPSGMNPPPPVGGTPPATDVPVQAVPPPPGPMTAPPPPPPPAAFAVTPTPAPPLPAPMAASKLPAFILWGVGGASLIAGASFGFAALSAKSDFDKTPTFDKADSVRSRAVLADVGIGLGAILAVTGAIFYFTADNPEGASPQAINPSPRDQRSTASLALQITPLISPSAGGGVLSMRF